MTSLSSSLPSTSTHRYQSELYLRAKAMRDVAVAHTRTLAHRKRQGTHAIDEEERTIPVTSVKRHGTPPTNGYFDDVPLTVPTIVTDSIQGSSCRVFSSNSLNASSRSSRLTMTQELVQFSRISTDSTKPISLISPLYQVFWNAYQRQNCDTAKVSVCSQDSSSVVDRGPPITRPKLHHSRVSVPATHEPQMGPQTSAALTATITHSMGFVHRGSKVPWRMRE